MSDDIESNFDKLVEEAVLSLPDEFAEKLQNVSVVVRDYPPPEILEKLKVQGTLLGLYQGVPFGKKSVWSFRVQPDMISIYKMPILSLCRTPQQVIEKVREVVIHEIGHHFGLSDKDMENEKPVGDY
jgi:predicted Zn-dependent protease with MMP-like domain